MATKKQTITKAEIAEHFVTVDQLHEDLTNLVHSKLLIKPKQQNPNNK